MIYAMNLYDIREGKEDTYREYMQRSVEVMAGIDVEPVASGHKPLKTMTGKSRGHFAVMKFGSMSDFDTLMERQEQNGINQLREESTTNYIWTLYEDWDIGAWLYSE
tara:strand:- start:324 stop:644 length:321 start_codon:yes stop_codon:yes gene_type:complete